jgi:microcin C transport system ATP-binding protein
MRRGRVVEQGSADDILDNPQDPYTKALMAAAFDIKADDTGAVSV